MSPITAPGSSAVPSFVVPVHAGASSKISTSVSVCFSSAAAQPAVTSPASASPAPGDGGSSRRPAAMSHGPQ